MRRTIKGAAGLLLAALMALSLVGPAAAEDLHGSLIRQGSGSGYALQGVRDRGAVTEIFGAAAEDLTAAYSYRLYHAAEDGISPYRATAELTFSAGDEVWRCTVEGDVDAIELGGGLIYLTGPLYGTVTIRGVPYQITAGYNQVEGRSGLSVTLVWMPEDEGRPGLTCSFGEQVVTDDVALAFLGGKPDGHLYGKWLARALQTVHPAVAQTLQDAA